MKTVSDAFASAFRINLSIQLIGGLEPILITDSITAGCKARCLRCRAKIVLDGSLATPAAILSLPPWPRTFRSASSRFCYLG